MCHGGSLHPCVQVEIHKQEAVDMVQMVEQLEKDNLNIMSELFECQVDDLKISRYATRRECR